MKTVRKIYKLLEVLQYRRAIYHLHNLGYHDIAKNAQRQLDGVIKENRESTMIEKSRKENECFA